MSTDTAGHSNAPATRTAHPRALPRSARAIVEAVAVVVLFLGLATLQRHVTPASAGFAPIWLPAGLVVAVAVVRGMWMMLPLAIAPIFATMNRDMKLVGAITDTGETLTSRHVVEASIVIAFAAVLRGIIARLFARRMLHHPSYDDAISSTALLVAVGPLACAPSALLLAVALQHEGFIRPDAVATVAATFWIGDAIAAMLLVPVALAWTGGPAWHARRLPIAAAALATAALVTAFSLIIGRIELDRIQSDFAESTIRGTAQVQSRLDSQATFAGSIAEFVGTTGNIDRTTFDTTFNRERLRDSGLSMIAWIRIPTADPEAAHVVFVDGTNAVDFRDSWIIDPARSAIERARDEGQPTWVTTDQDPGAVNDMLYVPVYDRILGREATPAQRRAAFIGVVAGRSDIQKSLVTALGDLRGRGTTAVLNRGAAPADTTAAIAWTPRREQQRIVAAYDVTPAVARTPNLPLVSTHRIDAGTESWTLTMAPDRTFLTDRSFVASVIPSTLISFALAMTLGVMALTFTGQRERLERLVRERTRALRDSEVRYRSVVDNVREAIFQLDDNDLVTFVSTAWDDHLSDGGAAGVVGTRLPDSLRVHDRDRVQQLIDTARAEPGRTHQSELRALDEGRLLELRVAATVLDTASVTRERQASIVGTIVDVTEHVGMLRNREQFVSTVVHELRNPLSVITGSAQMVQSQESDDLPPLTARLIPIMQTSIRKLERIIDDLLVTSQVDAGTLEIDAQEIDLAFLVRECVQQAAIVAEQRGVIVLDELDELEERAASDDACSARVTGDSTRITQIIDNLLSNAIKYTPAGGSVTVTVEPHPDAVRVAVADTGIGIAPNQHARVFERYGRTSAGAGIAPGTGLGLAICRSIAQAHGGTIELTSTSGAGSTFTLVMPRHLPPDAPLRRY